MKKRRLAHNTHTPIYTHTSTYKYVYTTVVVEYIHFIYVYVGGSKQLMIKRYVFVNVKIKKKLLKTNPPPKPPPPPPPHHRHRRRRRSHCSHTEMHTEPRIYREAGRFEERGNSGVDMASE